MRTLGVLVLAVTVVVAPHDSRAAEATEELALPSPALAGEPPEESVALTACGDGYLLAWQTAGGVLAARIARGGDVLDDPPVLVSSTGRSPAVAASAGSCAVAWLGPRPDWTSSEPYAAILGRRMSPDGGWIDPEPVVIEEGISDIPTFDALHLHGDGSSYRASYYTFIGGRSGIRTMQLSESLAPLAFGDRFPESYSYDRSWTQVWLSNGAEFVFAGPVSDYGYRTLPYDEVGYSPACSAAYGCSWLGGIDLAASDESAPAAGASDGTNYGIAWSTDAVTAYDPVTWDITVGSPPGLRFAIVEAGASRSYGLDRLVMLDADGGSPAVAFDGQDYVVVWAGGGPEMDAAVLGADGAVRAPKATLFGGQTYAAPLLASHGDGTALLAYATAPATGVAEVRARLLFTDSTPPVVAVPAGLTVAATRSSGAAVTFAVTAQDAIAGVLPAACLPASGALFPPGASTVTCQAIDPAGNAGMAAFPVHVAFTWSGFRPPLDPAGGATFPRGFLIPFRFALTGASAGVKDLVVPLALRRISDPAQPWSAGPQRAFLYVSFLHEYVFALPSGGLTPGVYEARIDLRDGVERAVRFTIR